MSRALYMTWQDLAFLHWPVAADTLRALVPRTLEVDTFGDSAWIAVTPFRMTGVRPRWMPPVPTASDFPELNVRTYVRHAGRTGVWFFSLDAASTLAVAAARVATGLPYFRAIMFQGRDGADITYSSQRHGGHQAFRARYRPLGDVFRSEPGTFEHWCTERYSLFVERSRALLRLDIEHVPWPLLRAEVAIERNTMLPRAVEVRDRAPHVLFARSLDVVAHWPRRATS